MGERSGPGSEVTCVNEWSTKLYFHRLVSPLTLRLRSNVFPGSPQTRSAKDPGNAPDSTAVRLGTFSLYRPICSSETRATAVTSKSFPFGKGRSERGSKAGLSKLYIFSSFSPDFPA